MDKNPWIQEFSGAIIVCDTEGIILEMNDQAIRRFQDQGGKELLGSNLSGCHPEPFRTNVKKLMEQQKVNVLSIEKDGIAKLVYQTPWYVDGKYSGFVAIEIVLPSSMQQFISDLSQKTIQG